jgi:hypothetical protein
MTRRPTPAPTTATRERRLYGAAAKAYAAAFRALYLFPLVSRREFRLSALWNGDGPALARLADTPDALGPPRKSWDDPSGPAHDAALIYWTMRNRRPRALLIEAATAIGKTLVHDRDAALKADAERYAFEAAHVHECRRVPRADYRSKAGALLAYAPYVYDDPGRACAMILRSLRRHGAEATRRMLEKKPQSFGPLFSTPGWRLWVIPVHNTTLARAAVSGLLRFFDDAVIARDRSGKAWPEADARGRFERLSAHAAALKHPDAADASALQNAARVIAILARRREVDERPRRAKPLPTIRQQLAAMLPPDALPLIDKAIRDSRKHSGEDPVCDRDRRTAAALGTDMAAVVAVPAAPGGLHI